MIIQNDNLNAQEKINLQRYARAHGVDQIAKAFRKGVSKSCRSALRQPQLDIGKACLEFRFPDGDPSVGLRRSTSRMREVHNSNMKNIQESIEHAQKNLVLANRRATIDKLLSGRATSQDVSQVGYDAMKSVALAYTDKFQSDPVTSLFGILAAGFSAVKGVQMAGGLYGAAVGGAYALGGGSLLAGAATAGGLALGLFESYNRLKQSFTWLPPLTNYKIETWGESAFTNIASFKTKLEEAILSRNPNINNNSNNNATDVDDAGDAANATRTNATSMNDILKSVLRGTASGVADILLADE